MLFSSIPFLYYFLPGVILLYFAVPRCLKNSVILLSSLFFYAWGEPEYLFFMLISITQGYIFGILIEKYHDRKWSKIFLAASVLISLGLLGYCKYADFFIRNFNAATGLSIPLLNIALPIGISFYTFQILSYVIDVYRGDTEAQKNYINLAAYIAMFPQLIAGPIVRYTDIAGQLQNRKHSLEDIAAGIRRFLTGLSKKILIANILGELVSVYKASQEKSLLFLWVYAIAYMLHVYFDFSGYSDMAIGLGRVFGFHFPENFNYPYISGSITEFWRRWHMSLGTWFRDYLYIPLGGNRGSKSRWLFNIFIVWMATGFWHGAEWNFVLWGIFFAVLLMAEKLWLLKMLNKIKLRIVKHIYTLFLVTVSFVIFDAASAGEAFSTISAMLGFSALSPVSFESIYYLKSYGVILAVAMVAATPLMAGFIRKIRQAKYGTSVLNVFELVYLTALLAVCTAYLIDGSFNPFLYFRF
ncbi:MAG: MBOAT family protein [Lachnospiraceae bacterium]|nr:MBOAT family protein [Lachnospiraceae bacterium]